MNKWIVLVVTVIVIIAVCGCRHRTSQAHNFEWRFQVTNGFEIHRNVSQSAEIKATTDNRLEIAPELLDRISSSDDGDGN